MSSWFEAIDLDIKLQNLAKGNYTASSPLRARSKRPCRRAADKRNEFASM